MTPVPVWELYAYKNDDPDCISDERRRVADWQLADVLGWCRHRGFDVIMFTRSDDTESYEKQPPSGRVRHSGIVSSTTRSASNT